MGSKATPLGTSLTERAFLFAMEAHAGQMRKYINKPYICHPVAVAIEVARYGGDDEEIAAALLHDTVEDCGVTKEQLSGLFGPHVAQLVVELSEVSIKTDGNRARRKEIDRQFLATVSPEAKTIKLADLICNTISIVAHDPDFARIYLKEKRALMEVLHGGNPQLYQLAGNILIAAEEVIYGPLASIG